MAVVQIQMRQSTPVNGCALFKLGFRPFFLGAGIFAVISMIWWMNCWLGSMARKIVWMDAAWSGFLIMWNLDVWLRSFVGSGIAEKVIRFRT